MNLEISGQLTFFSLFTSQKSQKEKRKLPFFLAEYGQLEVSTSPFPQALNTKNRSSSKNERLVNYDFPKN
jgi:hypothetical protein